jgi:hypothetical protein
MIGIANWLVQMAFASVTLCTIQLFLKELRRRSPGDAPRFWRAILSVMRWPLVLYMAALTALVLGLSLGVSVVVVAGLIAIQSIYARRVEESEQLEWLAHSVVAGGGSAPDAFEKFAGGRTTSVSRRCRDFAFYLRNGSTPTIAAKTSRIPLSVNALLMLEDGKVAAGQSQRVTLASGIREMNSIGWLLGGQFAYFVTFLLMINLVSFIYLFIVPTFLVMFDEFGISPNPGLMFLTRMTGYGGLIGLLLVLVPLLLLVLFLICYLFPNKWLLRVTPWFGHWMKSRGKYTGLGDLSAALRSGRSLVDSLKELESKTRSRWVRSRARESHRLSVSGQSTADALRHGGLINASESRWILAAERTNDIAESLDAIADSARRRFELLWRIRLSWMIPLTVVAFGLVVLLLFYAVMGSIAELIGGLT